MARHSTFERWRQRNLDYPVQAALAWALFHAVGLLPVDAASALGGWIGRTIGPLLPAHRRARRNLERAFPDKDAREIRAILRGMWDNLGRVITEYPHLRTIWDQAETGRIEVIGREHVEALRLDGRPGILVGAHLGNWELLAIGGVRMGLPLTFVYRHANNPPVDRLLRRARAIEGATFLPKGPEAARGLFATLRAGGHIAMLVDQKLNRGIAVPFFGRPAMTALAPAQFARVFDCPLVMVRIERLGGARFRLTIDPPLARVRTGDDKADDAAAMARINAVIEAWVRARPEQWLWTHRRWKD